MAAVISLQRYGDSFSTYYGEFTRMHPDKFNSPYAQSQVCRNMVIWQYGRSLHAQRIVGTRWQEQEKQQITTNLRESLDNRTTVLFHSFPKQFFGHRL